MIYLLQQNKNTISDDTIIVRVQNARSLSEHVSDIGSNDRIMNTDIIGLTETQINLPDSTCKIIEALDFSSIKNVFQ